MTQSVTTDNQPSINEWFKKIKKTKESKKFRKESDGKANRLRFLNQKINLPCQLPTEFKASELVEKSPNFMKFFNQRASKLCAIRLKPKKKNLPKFRNRGPTLKECYEKWFLKLNIKPENYIAQIYPHFKKTPWSSILIVQNRMIFGEITKGELSGIVYGRVKENVYRFCYDYKNWYWSERNIWTEKQIKKMVKYLKVKNSYKKKKLRNKLKTNFYHNYLEGYFEVVVEPSGRVAFVDYNRVFPKYIDPPFLSKRKNKDTITGTGIYPGKVKGKVVKVNSKNINKVKFIKNSILVCTNTDVQFLPFMSKAGAIITDRGGVLSHAAIVARELKKPTIVGTGTATKVLKSGDFIEVDSKKGIIRHKT